MSPQDKLPVDLNPIQPPEFPEIESLPATRVRVTQIKFSGNTVFTDEQLLESLEPYLNRELTFAKLQETKEIISKLYISQGYTTSGAYLPISENQNFNPQNATITIGVIEGKLEEIQITGADQLHPYIRNRLRHKEQDIFNKERLLEALRLLQVNPLFQSISAEIQPGTSPRTAVLKIMAAANNPFEISLDLNNHRSPSVTSFQRKATVGHKNILGFGDHISVNYSNTSGSNAFSGEYTIPINTSNGTLGFSYNYIDSKVTEEPFNLIDIEGDSSITQFTYRQPLIREASETSLEEFALGVSVSRYVSENSILGTPFPLSEGADVNGRTEISVIRFFQDWSKSSNKQAIALRSQISAGLDLFSPTINTDAPDGRFFLGQVQGQFIRNLSHGLQLNARGQFNIADRPLLGIEQLSIGGINSVRGYRQNALLRDSGALGSVEVSIPLLTQKKHALKLIPFIDFGTGWNYERVNPIPDDAQTNTLLSVGMGLSWQFKNNLFARINWGIPLISLQSQGNSLQEDGVTLSLQWQN